MQCSAIHAVHYNSTFISPSPSHARLLNLPKRPPTHRPPLCIYALRPRAVQHLQEIRGAPAHARVDVRFRRLDVVVEVVAEGLDVGDGGGAGGGVEVAGEED